MVKELVIFGVVCLVVAAFARYRKGAGKRDDEFKKGLYRKIFVDIHDQLAHWGGGLLIEEKKDGLSSRTVPGPSGAFIRISARYPAGHQVEIDRVLPEDLIGREVEGTLHSIVVQRLLSSPSVDAQYFGRLNLVAHNDEKDGLENLAAAHASILAKYEKIWQAFKDDKVYDFLVCTVRDYKNGMKEGNSEALRVIERLG